MRYDAMVLLDQGWVGARQEKTTLVAGSTVAYSDKSGAQMFLERMANAALRETIIELSLPDQSGVKREVLFIKDSRCKIPTKVVLTKDEPVENRGCLLALFGRRRPSNSCA